MKTISTVKQPVRKSGNLPPGSLSFRLWIFSTWSGKRAIGTIVIRKTRGQTGKTQGQTELLVFSGKTQGQTELLVFSEKMSERLPRPQGESLLIVLPRQRLLELGTRSDPNSCQLMRSDPNSCHNSCHRRPISRKTQGQTELLVFSEKMSERLPRPQGESLLIVLPRQRLT